MMSNSEELTLKDYAVNFLSTYTSETIAELIFITLLFWILLDFNFLIEELMRFEDRKRKLVSQLTIIKLYKKLKKVK